MGGTCGYTRSYPRMIYDTFIIQRKQEVKGSTWRQRACVACLCCVVLWAQTQTVQADGGGRETKTKGPKGHNTLYERHKNIRERFSHSTCSLLFTWHFGHFDHLNNKTAEETRTEKPSVYSSTSVVTFSSSIILDLVPMIYLETWRWHGLRNYALRKGPRW